MGISINGPQVRPYKLVNPTTEQKTEAQTTGTAKAPKEENNSTNAGSQNQVLTSALEVQSILNKATIAGTSGLQKATLGEVVTEEAKEAEEQIGGEEGKRSKVVTITYKKGSLEKGERYFGSDGYLYLYLGVDKNGKNIWKNTHVRPRVYM